MVSLPPNAPPHCDFVLRRPRLGRWMQPKVADGEVVKTAGTEIKTRKKNKSVGQFKINLNMLDTFGSQK